MKIKEILANEKNEMEFSSYWGITNLKIFTLQLHYLLNTLIFFL